MIRKMAKAIRTIYPLFEKNLAVKLKLSDL